MIALTMGGVFILPPSTLTLCVSNGGEHDSTEVVHCDFCLSFDYSQPIRDLSDHSLGV
jgi:hypothetical protein